MACSNGIQLNRHVIVKRNKSSRCCTVLPKTIVVIEKTKFYLDGALGHEYGGMYEVCKSQLVPCNDEDIGDDEDVELGCCEDASLTAEDGEQNAVEVSGGCKAVDYAAATIAIVPPTKSSIVQSNQTVPHEEVQNMKDEGTSGEEIVMRLVEGSSSFRSKSTFAKAKYLARKRRQHAARVLLLKPTIRLLSDIYYRKSPMKMLYLRQDSLAVLLSLSNVKSGDKVLVVENCLGLVTAAFLERLGGRGACVNLHKGEQCQSIQCVEAMDFSGDLLQSFHTFPIAEFFSASTPTCLTVTSAGDGTPETEPPTSPAVISHSKAANARDSEQAQEKKRRKQETLQLLSDGNFNAIVLASSFDPQALLEGLLKLLKPSGNLVAYHYSVEPLLRCFKYLRDTGTVIDLQLTDSFLRHYQVLPGRTHPAMTEYIASGYLLSGILVTE